MTDRKSGTGHTFSAKHETTPNYNCEEKKTFRHQLNHQEHATPPAATIDLKSLASENQCIKLIPSVQEIFRTNGFGFDSNLDDGTKSWLQKLQQSWNLWKKNANLVNLLHNFFETSDDPFTSVLILVINCQSFSDCKPTTLPYQIVEQLNLWSNKKEGATAHLTSNLKLTAFNIAKEQKNFSFIKLVVQTYRIDEEKENYLPFVRGILSNYKYKMAYHSIVALNLQNYICIEDLLVPLVLQDKSNLVEEYLSTCPEQAVVLVKFLDNLLERNSSIKSKIDIFLSIKDVPDVNWIKLNHKPLGKLISRLCNTYNIPLNTCEHLSRNRAIGGIRFLIHQKYQENVISNNAWDDLVIDTLKDKPELVSELIHLVNEYDTMEAYKWAKYFKIPSTTFPDSVKFLLASQKDSVDDNYSWAPSSSTSQNTTYLKLSLPSNKIIFIDTPEAFKDAVHNGLVGEPLVGLDSEWKPSFGAKQSTVSLIQISTKSNVFLFDALALNDIQYTSLWAILAENILDNNNVIKLGFGLENDMREIRTSVPGLSCLKSKSLSYLELLNLWKSVLGSGIQMPYKKHNVGEGLSSIAEQCLGKPLKKHEQCSNWENRPLRETQLEYAALDAYVLLDIYSVLEKLCINADLNFEDICFKVMAQSEKSKMKKSKKKQNRNKKTQYVNSLVGPNSNPVPVENVKLLLENTLSTLLNFLRSYGIDTILFQDNVKWENCVKIASEENRYIVIQSVQHKKVSKVIPTSHVYNVQSCNVEAQIKEIISYFNLQLQLNKMYGRCQVCNNNEIAIISQLTMRKLLNNSNPRKNTDHFPASSAVTSNLQYCAMPSSSSNSEDYYGDFLSEDEEEEDILIPVHRNLVLSPERIFVEQCLTRYGVDIQLNTLTDAIVNSNEQFYLCQGCGKCFWKNGYLPVSVNNLFFKLCQIK